ncbi:hypothetical protein [Roseburia sp. AF25-25LB]|uniref:hypothetical protein n=1 Tax=Roseburia sp. AF25-25LB TaxID=2293135 RepID=UPI000E4979B2|nr:hypothetical protein [Roseburia sp. AF25-25LB]RHQ42751.1 hypothetical protein DWY49_04790 [Roseburia sp. AF25-25LB]
MSRKSKIEPIVKVKIVEQYLAGEIVLNQASKNLGLLARVLGNGFLYTDAMDQPVYLINLKTRVTQKH